MKDVSELFKVIKLSSYEELLEQHGSVCVHRDEQIKHGHSRGIVADIFADNTGVEFQKNRDFRITSVKAPLNKAQKFNQSFH